LSTGERHADGAATAHNVRTRQQALLVDQEASAKRPSRVIVRIDPGTPLPAIHWHPLSAAR